MLICVFFFVVDVTDESKAVGPPRRDMLGDTERRVGVFCLLRPSKSRPAIGGKEGGTDQPAGSSAALRHVSALSPFDWAQLNPSPCVDFLWELSNETRTHSPRCHIHNSRFLADKNRPFDFTGNHESLLVVCRQHDDGSLL